MNVSVRQISLFTLILISLFILTSLSFNYGTAIAQIKKLENGWTTGSPMPSPRTEVTSVNLDDGVYVIGGFTSDNQNSAIVEMYNTTSNPWRTDITPLPVRLHHASSVSFQNRIYVVGGYTGDSTPSNRLYIYDPKSNTLTQGAYTPTPRGSPNANVVNGKLYVIGGDLNDQSLSVVESYDPRANRWTIQSPMPTSRHHAASAVVGENVYVIGGRLNSSYEGTDIVEKYNPISDEWTTDLEPMPSKRSGIGAATINGSI